MKAAAKLEASALRARAARERLSGTAHEIQSWLDPARLLDDAVDSVKSGAATIAGNTAKAVKTRPAVAAGGVALIVALFARGRFARRSRRKRDEGTD